MYPYLLAASLVANFADSLFGPLYAVYVQNIGGDILDVGSTIALYSIATGLLIILVGKFADRLSKELLTTIGFALGALGTLCYLVIDTPLELYVLQILFAVSTALLSAPLTALFAKNIDEKKAGLLWALEGGGNKMLSGFGLLIGTFVTYRFGFATVFIIIFLFQICSFVRSVITKPIYRFTSLRQRHCGVKNLFLRLYKAIRCSFYAKCRIRYQTYNNVFYTHNPPGYPQLSTVLPLF